MTVAVTTIGRSERARPFTRIFTNRDGMPTCHGRRLKRFVDGRKVRFEEWFSVDTRAEVCRTFNGYEDLATQVVAGLKLLDEDGGLKSREEWRTNTYVLPLRPPKNAWPEYLYVLWPDAKGEVNLKVVSIGHNGRRRIIYKGLLAEFQEERRFAR